MTINEQINEKADELVEVGAKMLAIPLDESEAFDLAHAELKKILNELEMLFALSRTPAGQLEEARWEL